MAYESSSLVDGASQHRSQCTTLPRPSAETQRIHKNYWKKSKDTWKELKDNWKKEFAYYLRAKKNISEKIIKHYIFCVQYILKHYYPNPTPEDIYRVKDSMLRKGYSRSYVNHIIFAFQHWFAWQGAPVKIKAIPRNKTIPRYLTTEEASKLFASCRDPRDKAIVALLLYGGLRANEVCKCNISEGTPTPPTFRRLHLRTREAMQEAEAKMFLSQR